MVLALSACKSEQPSPKRVAVAEPDAAAPPLPEPGPPTDEDVYRGDIGRICDVLALSGADQLEENARMFTVAAWLGDNLVTEEARNFLVALQQEADGAKKAGILRTEAETLGLPPCKLAESWH